MIPWVYDDGGREDAGFKGEARDCVCRAIAIATGAPYQIVYDDLNRHAQRERRAYGRSHARTGVFRPTYHRYLTEDLGWIWTPTMLVGSGCRMHLSACELPPYRRMIVKVSRHLCAVIDGVLRDTHDCSRDGTRCVYGFYYSPTEYRFNQYNRMQAQSKV